MTVARNYEGQGGGMVIDITGVASTAAAGIGEIANPEGVDVTITEAFLEIITPSTGAANLSCGVGASGASASDLWSAGAVNGLTEGALYLCFARQNTAETILSDPVDWDSDKYLTFTGSATTVGLSARLHVRYIRQAA